MAELYRTYRFVDGKKTIIIVFDDILSQSYLEQFDFNALGSQEKSQVRRCADILAKHPEGISLEDLIHALSLNRITRANDLVLQVSSKMSSVGYPLLASYNGYEPRENGAIRVRIPLADRVYRIYRYEFVEDEPE